MSRPRIATVLTAREWEPRLVDAARRKRSVRVVRRAYEPSDLDHAAPLDGVVVGSETSWVTAAAIRSLRRRNIGIVGIYPAGDRPGRELLQSGGVDTALPDSTDPDRLLDVVARVAAPAIAGPAKAGRTITVTGPRGAPGRTEVAVALGVLGAGRTRTVILDLDTRAPGVAFRLGLPPGPSLIDLVDGVRLSGLVASRAAATRGLMVVGASTPPPVPVGRSGVAHLLDAATSSFPLTVVDAGPWQPGDSVLTTGDVVVLVCDAAPRNLIRAAAVARDWDGPPPLVAVNRVPAGAEDEALRMARRALGLEPDVLIPELPELGPHLPAVHVRALLSKALATASRRDAGHRKSLNTKAV